MSLRNMCTVPNLENLGYCARLRGSGVHCVIDSLEGTDKEDMRQHLDNIATKKIRHLSDILKCGAPLFYLYVFGKKAPIKFVAIFIFFLTAFPSFDLSK